MLLMPSQGLSWIDDLLRAVAAPMKAFRKVWVLVCLSGACGLQAAEVWPAWVSWVMDGDTVLLVRQGQSEPVKLRIDGIDAPETCQPGGMASRDAMIRLTLRKSVQVTDLGFDSYGRQVGRLSADGVDVGAEMARSGMAWAYRFKTGRGPYAALQRSAQKEKKGVFSASEAAMSPPVFRRFHGACQGTLGQ
jgi:endonuclease YncB( thermonuclease family)